MSTNKENPSTARSGKSFILSGLNDGNEQTSKHENTAGLQSLSTRGLGTASSNSELSKHHTDVLGESVQMLPIPSISNDQHNFDAALETYNDRLGTADQNDKSDSPTAKHQRTNEAGDFYIQIGSANYIDVLENTNEGFLGSKAEAAPSKTDNTSADALDSNHTDGGDATTDYLGVDVGACVGMAGSGSGSGHVQSQLEAEHDASELDSGGRQARCAVAQTLLVKVLMESGIFDQQSGNQASVKQSDDSVEGVGQQLIGLYSELVNAVYSKEDADKLLTSEGFALKNVGDGALNANVVSNKFDKGEFESLNMSADEVLNNSVTAHKPNIDPFQPIDDSFTQGLVEFSHLDRNSEEASKLISEFWNNFCAEENEKPRIPDEVKGGSMLQRLISSMEGSPKRSNKSEQVAVFVNGKSGIGSGSGAAQPQVEVFKKPRLPKKVDKKLLLNLPSSTNEKKSLKVPVVNSKVSASLSRSASSSTAHNPVGLYNQGVTCYMNSVLQMLFHVNVFRKIVFRVDQFDGNVQLFTAFRRLFVQLQTSSTAIQTESLTSTMDQGKFHKFERQEDAHEMLKYVFDQLNSDAIIQIETSNLFLGTSKSIVQCLNVDYKSESEDTFTELSLTVEKDVEAAIRKYIEPERFSGNNKFNTDEKEANVVRHGFQDADKYTKFVKFPPVLVLHLNRFDLSTGRSVKDNKRCAYAEELDLNEFVESSGEDYTYTLRSVVVHQGKSVNSGHYFSFVNFAPGQVDSKWQLFNDDEVSDCSVKEALSDNFGGNDSNRTAYLLVYVQKNKIGDVLCDVNAFDFSHLTGLENSPAFDNIASFKKSGPNVVPTSTEFESFADVLSDNESEYGDDNFDYSDGEDLHSDSDDNETRLDQDATFNNDSKPTLRTPNIKVKQQLSDLIGYETLPNARTISFFFADYLIEYSDDLKRPIRTIELLDKSSIHPYKVNLKRPSLTNDYWNHNDGKNMKKRVDLIPSLGGQRSHLAASRNFVNNYLATQCVNVYSNLLYMFPEVNRGTYFLAEAIERLFLKLDSVERLIVVSGSIDCAGEEIDDWREELWNKHQINVPSKFYKSILLFKKNGSLASLSFLIPNIENADFNKMHELVVALESLESMNTGKIFPRLDYANIDQMTAENLKQDPSYVKAFGMVCCFHSMSLATMDMETVKRLNFELRENLLVCVDKNPDGSECNKTISVDIKYRGRTMQRHAENHNKLRLYGAPKTFAENIEEYGFKIEDDVLKCTNCSFKLPINDDGILNRCVSHASTHEDLTREEIIDKADFESIGGEIFQCKKVISETGKRCTHQVKRGVKGFCDQLIRHSAMHSRNPTYKPNRKGGEAAKENQFKLVGAKLKCQRKNQLGEICGSELKKRTASNAIKEHADKHEKMESLGFDFRGKKWICFKLVKGGKKCGKTYSWWSSTHYMEDHSKSHE